ncbi:MAG: extracellular solute-binding protein [Saccharofermentanales bacterium]
MRKKIRFRALSSILVLILLLTGTGQFHSGVAAEEDSDIPVAEPVRTTKYDLYLLKYVNMQKPITELILDGADFDAEQSSSVTALDSYEGRMNCVKLSSNSRISWLADVAEEGLYTIGVNYISVEGNRKNIEFALKINDEIPFEESGLLSVNLSWKDRLQPDGSIKRDSRGNELISDQTEVFEWLSRDLTDIDGAYNDAFSYYLKKGLNRIEIQNTDSSFIIGNIRIYNSGKSENYQSAKPSAQDQDNHVVQNSFIKIQGEQPERKSEATLYPIYDRSSPDTEKNDPLRIVRNTIGGANWSKPNQYIVWQANIPEDGYYKIGVKYRQNLVRGFYSTRKIMIDDQIVYSEMENIQFRYTDVFKNQVLSDGSEEMLFYLTAGIHKVRMEVTLGDLTEKLRLIQAAQAKLNEMYRKIIVVTSVEPDLARDYNLEAEIPELMATFNEIAGSLDAQYLLFEHITKKAGNDAKFLKEVSSQLQSFVQKPYTIPERLATFRANISALASWVLSIRSQPLEIDYITIFSPDQKMPEADTGFFNKLIYELNAFIGSFITDYNVIGEDRPGEKSIEVWLSSGREQSNILKDLVDSSFYTDTGINVKVKLVQGALMQCIMAGIGPDMALGLSRTDPVNLALRSALEPLDDYEGFSDAAGRFAATAMDPYEFDGKHYALPETQSFHMMFYRTDILDTLGIEPPETWEDFYKVSSKIQRNQMEIGIPYGGSTLTAESMSIFPTLLLQNGGTYYNEEKSRTLLSETLGIDTFIEWTEFYTQYSFPLVKDDYNRFRTGEMPLTIMPYTFYNQLQVAAPEIKNLWKMVQIPGTRKNDGSIDRSEAATGSGAVILAGAVNKEECWKFLDWWTSTDVQASFGKRIEMVIGAAGRYPTANVEALKKLPWSDKEIELILGQWQWVKEIPEVPGGYYLTRNIDNAFRAVVFRRQNARESLNYWNIETNKEITRKRDEYGLE